MASLLPGRSRPRGLFAIGHIPVVVMSRSDRCEGSGVRELRGDRTAPLLLHCCSPPRKGLTEGNATKDRRSRGKREEKDREWARRKVPMPKGRKANGLKGFGRLILLQYSIVSHFIAVLECELSQPTSSKAVAIE
ncbi:hypothetical protein N431DRAFT_456559 [Stipitochalara longipes BDJ]|nr:hypothetical protein N431DRAFT_456559 [Stipitochalara longipes BDJ]